MKKLFHKYIFENEEIMKKYLKLLKEFNINHIKDKDGVFFPSENDKKFFKMLLEKKK